MKTTPIRLPVETVDAVHRAARERDPDVSQRAAVWACLDAALTEPEAEAPPAPRPDGCPKRRLGGCWLGVAEANPLASLGDADGPFGVHRLRTKRARPDRVHCVLGCDGYRLLRRPA